MRIVLLPKQVSHSLEPKLFLMPQTGARVSSKHGIRPTSGLMLNLKNAETNLSMVDIISRSLG